MIFALVSNQKAFPHGAILRANLPISHATDKEHHRHHTEAHLPSPDIRPAFIPSVQSLPRNMCDKKDSMVKQVLGKTFFRLFPPKHQKNENRDSQCNRFRHYRHGPIDWPFMCSVPRRRCLPKGSDREQQREKSTIYQHGELRSS